ncbi:MAG: hypothetical protein RIM99_15875 [Cyclobacteriaceae bacterium]
MTIADLHELNERFQKRAVDLSELIPGGSLLEAASLIIRSSRRMHSYLEKMLAATSELQLGKAIEKTEEHLDEIIFILDQLDIANKEQKITLINDFVKQGYDLLSMYSACVDQIIKEKVASED